MFPVQFSEILPSWSSSLPLFLPVVVFLVFGCWLAPALAGTTVQWRLGCQSHSYCFLPGPAAKCRVGGPWEHARTHGRGSPPGQHARNKRTDADTTVSTRRIEKGMEGNERQEGWREGPENGDTYFPGQQERGQLVQMTSNSVERWMKLGSLILPFTPPSSQSVSVDTTGNKKASTAQSFLIQIWINGIKEAKKLHTAKRKWRSW